MKDGDEGYTVPWALSVSKEGDCYLRKNYTIQSEPGGTVKLRIKKTSNGYIAYINELEDEKWSREEIDMSKYVEVIGFGDDEVIEISKEEELEQALRDENYERASELRDEISSVKKDNPLSRFIKRFKG